jgi:hypothetical protein
LDSVISLHCHDEDADRICHRTHQDQRELSFYPQKVALTALL